MNQGCGSGACTCCGGGSAVLPDPVDLALADCGAARADPETMPAASVNGVPLHSDGQSLDADDLRQRACSELLRQAAQRAGLLDASDTHEMDGAQSEAASAAIEALLDQELKVPEPSDDDCRRYYDGHPRLYVTDEHVCARHILFAVTPGVDVVALRQKAEQILLDVRCHAGDSSQGNPSFAEAARRWSNCPSGAEGGELGTLGRLDCAPEFARELFATQEVGVLPRLVHSRFGLHVVEVTSRKPGTPRPFDAVREAVRLNLKQQTWATALRQYLRILAGEAQLVGVSLDASESPLIQ